METNIQTQAVAEELDITTLHQQFGEQYAGHSKEQILVALHQEVQS
jgi:hypothetical protein